MIYHLKQKDKLYMVSFFELPYLGEEPLQQNTEVNQARQYIKISFV